MKEFEYGVYHLGIALSLFVTECSVDPGEAAGYWSPGYAPEVEGMDGYIRLEPEYAWDDLEEGAKEFLALLDSDPEKAFYDLIIEYWDDVARELIDHLESELKEY